MDRSGQKEVERTGGGNFSRWEKPAWERRENLKNILKMVVDEFGEELTPNMASAISCVV